MQMKCFLFLFNCSAQIKCQRIWKPWILWISMEIYQVSPEKDLCNFFRRRSKLNIDKFSWFSRSYFRVASNFLFFTLLNFPFFFFSLTRVFRKLHYKFSFSTPRMPALFIVDSSWCKHYFFISSPLWNCIASIDRELCERDYGKANHENSDIKHKKEHKLEKKKNARGKLMKLLVEFVKVEALRF